MNQSNRPRPISSSSDSDSSFFSSFLGSSLVTGGAFEVTATGVAVANFDGS